LKINQIIITVYVGPLIKVKGSSILKDAD